MGCFFLPSEAANGVPGDLYVVVHSARDERFVRDGADLWRTEIIQVADAVLGTKLKAPTLDGSVDVDVPAGAQPDVVLRLRGKGLPRLGDGRGDLNLRIQVRIPEKVSGKERDLFEKLRALQRR